MDRRNFIALLGGVGAVWPAAVVAQSTGLKRVVLFWGFATDDPQWKAQFEALSGGLQKLGWVAGKNISFEPVPLVGRFDQLPDLAADLVATKVDMIVVSSGGIADVVHGATRSIPIVVAAAGDLEGTGLIASLNRPGGNVTGSQILSPSLMSKRLGQLKQLVPGLTRLGVMLPITQAAFITPRYLEVIGETARAINVETFRAEVHSPEHFGPAYAKLRQDGCDAAVVLSTPLTLGYRSQLVEAAVIPTMYESELIVRAGGLVSYGPTILPLYREAATYIDKILRGASPAELPINQPTEFGLSINLKTAKAFGLTVPPTMLALADKVIE
jgi:putative ABC transport system substrate-binding protein